MIILFYIAMAILVIAALAYLFTDVHPAVFFSAWLFALVLLTVGDVVQGPRWGIVVNLALMAVALWLWRKDAQDRRRKAAKA